MSLLPFSRSLQANPRLYPESTATGLEKKVLEETSSLKFFREIEEEVEEMVEEGEERPIDKLKIPQEK